MLERDEKTEIVSTYGEELVRRFVSSIVNLEHIHKLRRESSIKGFDPKVIFEFLDYEQKGYLNVIDFQRIVEGDAKLLVLKFNRWKQN